MRTILDRGESFLALGGDFRDQEYAFSPSTKDPSSALFTAKIKFDHLADGQSSISNKDVL